MKVAINRCFGGFHLSPAAKIRMANILGEEVHFYHAQYHDTGREPTFTKITPNEALECLMATELSHDHGIRFDGYPDDYCQYDNLERNNPVLIQVIEELGEAASSKLSKIKVIEIPDDVDWMIDDYDGLETLHEKHRVWS